MKLRSFKIALLVTLVSAGSCFAQQGWTPTDLKDTSALKPPAGSNVAVVSFMDLECPVCAQVDPVVAQAVAQNHIAWAHHDFPLPMHNWSFAAAVNARFFDSKSAALGDAYRASVFENQNNIDNVPSLTDFTQKFAQSHQVPLPFIMDPGEKFSNEVKADRDLAHRMNLDRTPTIFVVAQTANGPSYVEVLNKNNLETAIDQMKAKAVTTKTVATTKAHAK